MKPETASWVEIAEDDYRTIRITMNSRPPIYRSSCYHAQQCAEKYLKAFLYEHSINFARTHDLPGLLALCQAMDVACQMLTNQIVLLDPLVSMFRYPDPRAKAVRATRNDAQRAYQAATEVRAFIRAKLGI